MHLTKLELQEMLREMGVKFSHNESYENLKRLFQEENHMRWMGKVSTQGQRSNGYKQVVRKRSAAGSKKMMVLSNPPVSEKRDTSTPVSLSKTPKTISSRLKSRRKNCYPKPDNPTPSSNLSPSQEMGSSRGRDIFATVLRRAQNCCELCGGVTSVSVKQTAEDLNPFYILSPELGGDVSIKNMVALCSRCHGRLSADASPADLKQLKRRARGKIIRTIEIQRKAVGRK